MFGKKPSVQDQLRQQSKDLRKTQRDLERDRRELERQEKQLELEIKKAAKQGNKQVCTVLAKQLIQVRKQKARSLNASSKVTSIGAQSKMINANVKLAGAMATTSKTMGAMNKQINPEQMMKTMQEFEKENTKMEMKEEIMEDTLNSVFEESGDEEEQDQIVTQVLDEIGIEITGKMSKAPTGHLGDKLPADKSKQTYTDDEIEKKLAALKVS